MGKNIKELSLQSEIVKTSQRMWKEVKRRLKPDLAAARRLGIDIPTVLNRPEYVDPQSLDELSFWNFSTLHKGQDIKTLLEEMMSELLRIEKEFLRLNKVKEFGERLALVKLNIEGILKRAKQANVKLPGKLNGYLQKLYDPNLSVDSMPLEMFGGFENLMNISLRLINEFEETVSAAEVGGGGTKKTVKSVGPKEGNLAFSVENETEAINIILELLKAKAQTTRQLNVLLREAQDIESVRGKGDVVFDAFVERACLSYLKKQKSQMSDEERIKLSKKLAPRVIEGYQQALEVGDRDLSLEEDERGQIVEEWKVSLFENAEGCKGVEEAVMKCCQENILSFVREHWLIPSSRQEFYEQEGKVIFKLLLIAGLKKKFDEYQKSKASNPHLEVEVVVPDVVSGDMRLDFRKEIFPKQAGMGEVPGRKAPKGLPSEIVSDTGRGEGGGNTFDPWRDLMRSVWEGKSQSTPERSGDQVAVELDCEQASEYFLKAFQEAFKDGVTIGGIQCSVGEFVLSEVFVGGSKEELGFHIELNGKQFKFLNRTMIEVDGKFRNNGYGGLGVVLDDSFRIIGKLVRDGKSSVEEIKDELGRTLLANPARILLKYLLSQKKNYYAHEEYVGLKIEDRKLKVIQKFDPFFANSL